MSDLEINQYSSEKEVEYSGEHYVVRDNGSVFRKTSPTRRRSQIDENWTFGRQVKPSGYMVIGSHPVHRIVAFAFIGKPPSEKHIVDHIDVNRSNNRVENLRWVTKLENVLRHPSTRQRIFRAYGTIEQFIENPGKSTRVDKSIEWLKTVSSEEAQKAWEKVLRWAESDGRKEDNGLASRIYGVRPEIRPIERKLPDRPSLTPLAIQRKWKTPTVFPHCPQVIGLNPLAEYAANLNPGTTFSKDKYKKTIVVERGLGDSILSILVESGEENSVKPWVVAKVTIEDDTFIHESIGTFFDLNGARKAHYELLGIPFKAESIDDFC